MEGVAPSRTVFLHKLDARGEWRLFSAGLTGGFRASLPLISRTGCGWISAMRNLALAALATAALVLGAKPALSACGQNGGPGYRNSSGKCVGWEALARQCGNPPTTKCTPELVADGAGEAANKGQSIRSLMQGAHEKAKQSEEAPPSRNP